MDQALIRQYKLISSIQSQISKSSTLEEALHGAMRLIREFTNAEAIVIWCVDQSDETLLRPLFWLADRDISAQVCEVGQGVVGKVYEQQQAARYLDYSGEFAAFHPLAESDSLGFDVRSMVVVPFSSIRSDLGCIQFIGQSDGALFSEDDADTFEIAVTLASLSIDQNQEIAAQEWKPGKKLLSLQGITREFQNGDTITRVLRGVNLDVYEGEFLALLGESGCGKTTLLNIVGGLDTVTSGEVFFGGQNLTNATRNELTAYRRENLGFVFQAYNLMPNLTALQNVQLIAELVDDPMDPEEALSVVGLSERLHNYPSQLSGGQQQRVSIARALVKRPRLILADEPTAALDYATSIEVLQVLERVIAGGTTLVMVTHNEEIARMADRIVRLRVGKTYETTINTRRAQAADLVW